MTARNTRALKDLPVVLLLRIRRRAPNTDTKLTHDAPKLKYMSVRRRCPHDRRRDHQQQKESTAHRRHTTRRRIEHPLSKRHLRSATKAHRHQCKHNAHQAARPNGRREASARRPSMHRIEAPSHTDGALARHAESTPTTSRRTQHGARNATKVLTTDTMPKGKPSCAPMVAHHARGAHLGGGGCSNVMETPNNGDHTVSARIPGRRRRKRHDRAFSNATSSTPRPQSRTPRCCCAERREARRVGALFRPPTPSSSLSLMAWILRALWLTCQRAPELRPNCMTRPIRAPEPTLLPMYCYRHLRLQRRRKTRFSAFLARGLGQNTLRATASRSSSEARPPPHPHGEFPHGGRRADSTRQGGARTPFQYAHTRPRAPDPPPHTPPLLLRSTNGPRATHTRGPRRT